MRIQLTTELRQMSKDIRSFGRQAAFAQVVALTRTAIDVRSAEVHEIDDSFDRPTPYTRNAVFVKPATKETREAQVGIKDDFTGANLRGPSSYLEAQIDGGRRNLRGFEVALQRAGAMPPFSWAVPGKFARLDAYGNISRGQIIQILSQLRTGTNAGFTRNLPRRGESKYADREKKIDQTIRSAYRRAGGQYFAVPFKRGRLQPGIYQRRDFRLGSAAPRAVIRFVPATQNYDRRFAFFDAAEFAAEKAYPHRLEEALAQYLPDRS